MTTPGKAPAMRALSDAKSSWEVRKAADGLLYQPARDVLNHWRDYDAGNVDTAWEILSESERDKPLLARVSQERVAQMSADLALNWYSKADRFPKLHDMPQFAEPPICWTCVACWAGMIALAVLAVIGVGNVAEWMGG